MIVRRSLAFVLVQALVASSATTSALHVHEYVGHDHPDHHHGPATHEHQQSALADCHHQFVGHDDHQPSIEPESCDPGRHAVSVTLGCACVPQVHVELSELAGATVAAPAAPIRSAIPVTDVRVHGPPFESRIPARAPPLIPHA
jgi:hypothetical protein